MPSGHVGRRPARPRRSSSARPHARRPCEHAGSDRGSQSTGRRTPVRLVICSKSHLSLEMSAHEGGRSGRLGRRPWAGGHARTPWWGRPQGRGDPPSSADLSSPTAGRHRRRLVPAPRHRGCVRPASKQQAPVGRAVPEAEAESDRTVASPLELEDAVRSAQRRRRPAGGSAPDAARPTSRRRPLAVDPTSDDHGRTNPAMTGGHKGSSAAQPA
jgi:hypothetical protein